MFLFVILSCVLQSLGSRVVQAFVFLFGLIVHLRFVLMTNHDCKGKRFFGVV